MDMKGFKEFMGRRHTIWTLSLCMTGIIVLGGITAVDRTRRMGGGQQESEAEEWDSGIPAENARIANETLDGPLGEEQAESGDAAAVWGSRVAEDLTAENEDTISESTGIDGAGMERTAEQEENMASESALIQGDTAAEVGENTDGVTEAAAVSAENVPDKTDNEKVESSEIASAETISGNIVSEQMLLNEGIAFTPDDAALMWPSAGSLLMDYSMDGTVYFSTLNQYKYNPALVIGTDVGNQVLASAKGMVESIYESEETGTTLVMNIGNGYRLIYGQLKDLLVQTGDTAGEGTVLGYVAEPTKYYTKEGSNLYFEMTKDGVPVDPVQFLD